MSEAVEIVARAMWVAQAGAPARFDLEWERGGLMREHWTAYARAAIQALRKPNSGILKILREGIVMDGYEPHPGQAENIWDRCIDALLNDAAATESAPDFDINSAMKSARESMDKLAPPPPTT